MELSRQDVERKLSVSLKEKGGKRQVLSFFPLMSADGNMPNQRAGRSSEAVLQNCNVAAGTHRLRRKHSFGGGGS